MARGAELLIFLDVDCLPDEGLVTAYREATQDPATAASLLCGPVAYLPPPGHEGYDLQRLAEFTPHPGRPAPAPGEQQTDGDPRLFWSLSFALTATTWRRIGGFDEEFVGYGDICTIRSPSPSAAAPRCTPHWWPTS
jgi:hypothetical protein